jgi:hypothetical protein
MLRCQLFVLSTDSRSHVRNLLIVCCQVDKNTAQYHDCFQAQLAPVLLAGLTRNDCSTGVLGLGGKTSTQAFWALLAAGAESEDRQKASNQCCAC